MDGLGFGMYALLSSINMKGIELNYLLGRSFSVYRRHGSSRAAKNDRSSATSNAS
jgi:hypothetical protein